MEDTLTANDEVILLLLQQNRHLRISLDDLTKFICELTDRVEALEDDATDSTRLSAGHMERSVGNGAG